MSERASEALRSGSAAWVGLQGCGVYEALTEAYLQQVGRWAQAANNTPTTKRKREICDGNNEKRNRRRAARRRYGLYGTGAQAQVAAARQRGGDDGIDGLTGALEHQSVHRQRDWHQRQPTAVAG